MEKLKNYINFNLGIQSKIMDLKLRLDEVLRDKNMTQVELARKIHKSKVTVNYWCSNKNYPSLSTLSEIAKVLKVKISDLIKE